MALMKVREVGEAGVAGVVVVGWSEEGKRRKARKKKRREKDDGVTWREGQPGQPQTGVKKDDFLLADPFHAMYLSYKSAG